MADLKNLLANIPAVLPVELVELLVRAPGVRIERIVSRGHRSADGQWYDQKFDEFVVLIAGAGRLQFEGRAELLEMAPGSIVNIPAHCRHRVEWTDPAQDTVWLVVHYGSGGPPRA